MTDNHEWVQVQTKTFTKWANLHLASVHTEISNLTEDLSDGVCMIKLLEVLGGESICKSYNKEPKMRIHQLENMNQCLKYLTEKQKMKLVNIGSSDIVDKNERITLALLWNCILHFQVSNIEIEGIAGKSALLLWCKRSVERFSNLKLENFTNSWVDGLGFAGLISRYRPDLISFEEISALTVRERLEKTFDVAKTKLGIPSLLDVSDFDSQVVDEKSIITYVSEYFKTFAPLSKAGSLAKALKQAWRTTDVHRKLIREYEQGSAKLVQWMQGKQQQHKALPDIATLEEGKKCATDFEVYTQSEKPNYHLLLLNLDGTLSKLHSSQKRNGRPLHKESITVDLLNESWKCLCDVDQSFAKQLQSRMDELEQLTLKGQRLECLLNRVKSHTHIIQASIANEEGSLEIQLERINQNLEDCQGIQVVEAEIDALGKELEDKLKSCAHSSERAACHQTIVATQTTLQSAKETLLGALERQHHLEELAKDYQKRTHQYFMSLQQYEDELQVPVNHPWNDQAPPSLPSLQVLVAELTEGNLTSIEPSLETLEKERSRLENMRQKKQKEREEYNRKESARRQAEEALKKQVASFENDVTGRIRELNTAVEHNDAGQIENLHQGYLQSPFLKDIETLPNASKVSLRDNWTHLGRLFRENGAQKEESSASALDAEQVQEITSVFYTYDHDKTGKLGEPELQSCLTSLGYVIGEDMSGKLEDADPAHKGFVTLKDLMDYILKNQDPGEGQEALEKSFAAFHPGPLPVALGKTLFNEEWDNMVQFLIPENDMWDWKGFISRIYEQ